MGPTLDEKGFRDLIRRVRAGDARAATELVRDYQEEIRRIVRIRLTDPRMRTELESMDICQSVMGNFFARVAAGQFDLERPEDLLRLLATMAMNKVRDRYRKLTADKRDHQVVRGEDSCDPAAQLPDPGRGPDSIVAEREILARIRGRLTDDELYIYEQRSVGREWAEIAADLPSAPEPVRQKLAGSKPDALRKKYVRALNRVLEELGIDSPECD
jgi:DNA-directed RNA polymerase specialized sigma24 family protein